MVLALILLGAPWSILVIMLLAMLPWTVLPWMLLLVATTTHALVLMLIAVAVLNVGLHALAARRGHVVVPEIARKPPVVVAAVTAVAFAVAVPLAAYASYVGAGPTAVLLILVGGVVIPAGVTVVGSVGRREAA